MTISHGFYEEWMIHYDEVFGIVPGLELLSTVTGEHTATS